MATALSTLPPMGGSPTDRLNRACWERGRVDAWLTLTAIPRKGKAALSEPGQGWYERGFVHGQRQVETYQANQRAAAEGRILA